MRRFLFTAVFALIAVPPARAEEPRREPTPAEIKKQIAETEAAVTKKKVELAKAQAALKAADDEYKQVKELGPDRLQEADTIAKLMVEAPRRKATAARLAAEKAAKSADVAARVAITLGRKLKDAGDPTAIEALKKELAEAEAAAKKAAAEAQKAQTAAKDAAEAFATAQKEAALQRQSVIDLQDKAMADAAKNVVSARKDVARVQDELERAEVTLRRLKEQLKALDK